MKKYLLIVLACISLIACQKEMEKPTPFITEDKMEHILYDLAVLYGVQSTNAFYNDSVVAFKMTDILAKYDVDSLAFADNNKYYMNLKKSIYYEIQNRVLERLIAAQKIADSLSGGDELLPLVKTISNQSIEEEATEEVLVSATDVEMVKEKTTPAVKTETKEKVKNDVKLASPAQMKRFREAMKQSETLKVEKVE